MKFNKLMIIGLVILILFTMAGVSAADENVSDSQEDMLSVAPLDCLEADESAGSFEDLGNLVENASGGDTLYLENDYVNDGSISQGINISETITVDGQNHTINANMASNIFNVKNSNVILKNINFINAIDSAVNGTCTLYDCSFVDCYSNRYGGAIYFSQEAGNAYNCYFENCSASTGGAIASYNVKSNAYNCVFKDCSASYYGALFRCDAYGCSFLNCSAENNGGATSGNANNCTFENCHAGVYGGAIYTSSKTTINNCSFVNCSAGKWGGAIQSFAWVTAKSSSFVDCYSGEKGGAIYADSKLQDCSFVNCHSINGGALYSYHDISTIRNCSFDNCSADKYGGAVYSGNVYESSITDCSAGKYGAAIYNGNASNSSIIGWYAPGGAIYKGDAYNCTMLESPHIVISPDFSVPNENININIAISKNAEGNVMIALNGETYTCTIRSGKANVTVGGLGSGIYEIVANYNGNSKCSPQTVSSNLVVGKIYPTISVDATDETCFGNSTLISVEISKDATGFMHILIDGKDNKVKISNGQAILNVSGVKVGTHNVTAKYGGNYKYYPEQASTSFEVVKGTPMTSISAPSITCGDSATVTVSFSSYVNGYVKIIIGNNAVRTKIANGSANASFSGLGAGTHNVTAIYSGTANFNAQTINTTLSVSKGKPIKSVSVKNIKVGHDAVVNVKMADNVNGFVKITVNGVTQRVQIINGTATLSVSGLKAGSYSATVYYAGNKNFNAQTKTAYFSVTKSTPRISVSTSYYENPKLTKIWVHINQDATGYLRVTYEGTTYRLPIENGAVYIQVDGYIRHLTVVASYGGNYKYTAVNETINFPY